MDTKDRRRYRLEAEDDYRSKLVMTSEYIEKVRGFSCTLSQRGFRGTIYEVNQDTMGQTPLFRFFQGHLHAV